jgi:DNA-nicking Smr family endonuclease
MTDGSLCSQTTRIMLKRAQGRFVPERSSLGLERQLQSEATSSLGRLLDAAAHQHL